MFVMARKTAFVSRILHFKLFTSVGIFSYSLYLIHLPIQQVVWQYIFSDLFLNNDIKFFCFFVFSFMLIIIIAYGFYRVFELPFVKMIKK